MHLLLDGMVALDKQAVASVDGERIAIVNTGTVDLTVLFGLLHFEILAADHTCFLQPYGDHRGMRGLAAP